MKRWTALLLCIALLLTGCAKEQEETVEITLVHGWGSTEPDHVSMRKIYEDFEAENPGIRVNLVSLPTMDDMLRTLEDSIMVGDIPDIVFLAGQGRNSIYEYMVTHHYALDLMPYLEQDPELAASIPAAMREDWTTAQGQLYTVSDVVMLGGGYWINRQIAKEAGIEEIPDSWEAFSEACRKINIWAKREDFNIKAMHPSWEGYLYFLSHILAQLGSCDAESNYGWDEAVMWEALSILEQLYQQISRQIPDADAYNYRDETGLFNEGKLAIYVNGVWGASMIKPAIDAEYVLFPSEERSISCESSAVGYVLGSTGDADRQEASVRFLKYILSREVQEKILFSTQQVPANPQVQIDAYGEQMPRLCQAVKTAQDADCRIEIPQQHWNEQQLRVFEEHLIDVISGKMQKQTLIDLLKR